MWIVYGATETIEGNSEHAYNSAFICSPEGEVTTYQKISPDEGSWCKSGETPVLIKAQNYGYIGISISNDTYDMPEIARYYSAKGCNILLNLSASSKNYIDTDGDGIKEDMAWEWYYKNRIESNTSRDGYTLLSANLVGSDGPADTDGNQPYNFPGGSVILQADAKYYAGTTDKNVTSNTNADIITGEEGLITNKASLQATTGTACSNSDFSPENYAKWYNELAVLYRSGYKSIYNRPGDVNDDTEVNISDATYIQFAIIGNNDATDKCDLNGDGVVSILDVTLLQKYLAGYDVTLK